MELQIVLTSFAHCVINFEFLVAVIPLHFATGAAGGCDLSNGPYRG